MFIILLCVTTTEGSYSYYTYNYSAFVNALVAFDKYQMQTTGNATYASYWIKLMDADSGTVIKSEERNLTEARGDTSEE